MRKLLPIILIVAVLGVVYAVYVRNERLAQKPLGPAVTVSFLNADLGGGVLIKTPEGKFTILDPGPAGSADKLCDYLDGRGVSKLDVILSSRTPSRAGALSKLLEMFLIKRITHGEAGEGSSDWLTTVETARTQSVWELTLCQGDRVRVSKSVMIEALAPPHGLLKDVDQDSEDNSLVVRLRVGGVRFLMLSEGGAKAESALLKSGLDLQSDVLWAARRGGLRGTSLELLASVRPRFCVVTAGGRFGRPSGRLLKRIGQENTGAALYRTDRDGTIDIMTDGREVTVQTEERP